MLVPSKSYQNKGNETTTTASIQKSKKDGKEDFDLADRNFTLTCCTHSTGHFIWHDSTVCTQQHLHAAERERTFALVVYWTQRIIIFKKDKNKKEKKKGEVDLLSLPALSAIMAEKLYTA